jgi:hypothetical protein
MKTCWLVVLCSIVLVTPPPLRAQEPPRSPAEGYAIHIVAPHRHEDGTIHGPYHHYCKPIKPEIMQCLIFLSTDPNAELVEIEYFIDKKLARTNVTLEQWNKHFHDHQEEVASGRVQVLDVPPEKAQALAEVFHQRPVVRGAGARGSQRDDRPQRRARHRRPPRLRLERTSRQSGPRLGRSQSRT